ncbi:MAG: DegV family protein [Anaerolineaceae bacterium]|nr:DegV family protein [Anaerolineaceae bacterium]
MSHPIALITDSTCDIPEAWLKQYDIRVIPLTIIFGDEQFLDGVDLSAVEFYQRILTDPVHPSTSQATPKNFLDAYKQAAADGAEQIVAIILSGAMSSTIESARQAAQDSPIPVHILDGKNNSMGLGWQVIAAARVREEGGSIEAMQEAALAAQKNMVYYILLDTIEYLSKGGRIAGATSLLNSILKIKPMIYVNPEIGKVGASLPARSRKVGKENLYKEFFKHINTKLPMHITVLHNNCLDEAEALAERIRQEYNPKELIISIVSPILGVHTGPRALALCGYAG